MKRFIHKVASYKKTYAAKAWIRQSSDIEINHFLPYQCQFPSERKVKEYLENGLTAKDDSKWRAFGFTSVEQVDYWSHRACGIACAKMLIDKNNGKLSMAELINESMSLNGYDIEKDSGWYYKPLSKLLAQHEIKSTPMSQVSIEYLAYAIHQSNVLIASVNPQIIRNDKKITSTKKSGHLVLVTGFRLEHNQVMGFYLHNPWGKTEATRRKSYIPIEQFKHTFGERGILVQLPNA